MVKAPSRGSTSRVSANVSRGADFRSFGDTLKELRSARQLTQTELGRAIRRSTSFISLLEAGQRKPSRPLIDDLAEALSLSHTSDERRHLLRSAGFEPNEIADSVSRLADAIAEHLGVGESGKLLARTDLAAIASGWADYFRIRKHFDQGSITLALEGYERALARRHYSPALMTWLRMGLAETLVQQGDVVQAEVTIREARADAEDLQQEPNWSPTLGAEVRAVQGLVAAHGDNFPLARMLIEQAIGEYEKLVLEQRFVPDVAFLGLGASYKRLGQVLLMQGEPKSALTLCLNADAYLKQVNDSSERRRWLHRTRELMAWAYSKLKDFTVATRMREETHQELVNDRDDYGLARNTFYSGDDCLDEIDMRVAEALRNAPSIQNIRAHNDAVRATLRETRVSHLLDQADKHYHIARKAFESSGQDALLGRTFANLGRVLRYKRLRDDIDHYFSDARALLVKAVVHEGRIGLRRRLPDIYETLAELFVDQYEHTCNQDDLARALDYYRLALLALPAAHAPAQDGEARAQRARIRANTEALSPLLTNADATGLTEEEFPDDLLGRWDFLCKQLINTTVRNALRITGGKSVVPVAYSTRADEWCARLLEFEEQAEGRILIKNELSDSLSDKFPPGILEAGARDHTTRQRAFYAAVARARGNDTKLSDLCCRASVEASLEGPLADLVYTQASAAESLMQTYPSGYRLEGAPYPFPLAFVVGGSQALIEAPVKLAHHFIGDDGTPLTVGTTICMAFDDEAFANELRDLFHAFVDLSVRLYAEPRGEATTQKWLSNLLKNANVTLDSARALA